MKAIIINNEFRYLNSFDSFGNTLNIQQASPEQLYEFGFREVIVPTVSDSQKLGDRYFDTLNDVWTYYVLDKTAEELAVEAEQLKFMDDSANLESKYEEDGKKLYQRIKFRIRRLYQNGTITLAQFNTVRRFLRPAVLPLTTGDWDIAKENVDALTVPTNAKLLAILNTVKSYINDYITANNIQ